MDILGSIGLILLGAMMIVSALAVILMPNALYSALCLIVNLVSLALAFLVLQAEFLFVAQILVYAGAIVVLFLFAVTILNPQDDNVLSGERRPQFAITLLFGAILAGLLTYIVSSSAINGQAGTYTPDAVAKVGNIQAFGIQLFTVFLLPFEATALVLLVGIVGAIVMGKHAADMDRPPRRYQVQFSTGLPKPPPPTLPAGNGVGDLAEQEQKEQVGA